MSIEFHRNMLVDRVRNDAFYKALQKTIRPGETVVADIGSGTGLLAMLASRLGAKKCYLIECGDVFYLSEKLARANGITNLEFIHEHSTALLDLEPIDLVVSETLGNFAYEENIIATIADARRFLKPHGMIIPRRISQYVVPVVTDRYLTDFDGWDQVGYDLDFSEAKRMSLNNLYVRLFNEHDLLDKGSAARCWDDVNFSRRTSSNRRGKVSWVADESVAIFGFCLWWQCELMDEIVLSTSPLAPRTHWEQLYLPILTPIVLLKGHALELALAATCSFETGSNVRWEVTVRHADGKLLEKQRLDMREGYIE